MSKVKILHRNAITHGVWLSAILLAWVVWISVASETVHGCSCGPGLTQKEAFERSSSVFSGRVISIGDAQSERSSWDDLDVVEFKVYTVWKGVVSAKKTVKTHKLSVSCGYSFVKWEEYLVYTTSRGDWVGSCGRTQLLSGASKDLVQLRIGQLLDTGRRYGLPQLVAIASAGVSLLAVTVAGMVWLRRRRVAS